MKYTVNCSTDFENIVKYIKTNDILSFTCINCGNSIDVKYRPERIEKYKKLLCKSCTCKNVRKNNPYSWIKALETNRKNHNGVLACQTESDRKRSSENHKNHKEWQEKSLETNRKNHNGVLACQTESGREICRKNIKQNLQKMQQKQKEKYNGVFYMCTPEFKEKSKQTKFEKYGDEFYTNFAQIKETVKKTYGVDNFILTEKFKIAKENYIKEHPELPYYAISKQKEKYDGKMWTQTEYLKIDRELNPEKYQSHRIGINRLISNLDAFDSIPEFCVYLYCIYHWIPIIRNNIQYFEYKDIRGVVHRTYPDFIINGQYVEIKGAHFFKPNGDMYLPYRKSEWSDDYYEYMCSIYESKRQCLIKNNVLILKDTYPWVQNCINWVNNMININLFIKSNYNNLCYGYTPYNYNKYKEYQNNIGVGLTPFDVK